MSWDIPQSCPVTSPSPPDWPLWWRAGALCCFLLILTGAGLWFWLHDSRVLLWTLAAVMGGIALFALLAGWLLFRFGVDAEHAEELRAYNVLQEHAWQRWAQQSIPVVGWHTIFAPEVLIPQRAVGAVNSDIPLSLPTFTGDSWLAEEIIMALLPELRSVIDLWPLEVTLPEGAGNAQWRQFVACWQQCGLSTNRLTVSASDVSAYDGTLRQWLAEPETGRARLVIIRHWTGSGEYTEGVVALLLAPRGREDAIPVRCSLHRPLSVDPGNESAAFSQFLRYQPLTLRMTGLWTDRKSKPLAAGLVVRHGQRLNNNVSAEPDPATEDPATVTPVSLPDQYFMPHWLGHTGPRADWFAIAMMMEMAKYNGGVQCGVLSSGSSSSGWILSSVSAGAFIND